MAGLGELFFAPAARLVSLLRSREISSTELTAALLERIEEVNPKLNAVVTLAEERAIEEAEDSDRRLAAGRDVRPLEGLPITIKDSIETAGIRSTDGMKILEHHVPERDAPTVARLRAAGAVIIGKTNIPEMAFDYDCENPVFGATHNPWNRERVPGGSSGGEAAALAAGLTPLGLGSDYRGSIRVPAHFCGVAGLKPSWGTIPATGHLPPSKAASPAIAHMGTIGPLARHIDDLTIAYNILRGPHPSAPHTVPSTEAQPERVDIKRLPCAIFTNGGGAPVRKEICAAVERAGRALLKIGVAVESAMPPIQNAERLWFDFATGDGNRLVREALGDNLKHSRERLKRALIPLPERSATDYFRTFIERDIFRIELAEFMERLPIIICAPFCTTAFAHGVTEVDIDGATYPHMAAGWPAAWVNCAGLPAAVVPAGLDRDGLPIGVQVVGRAFHEESVLAIARALEQELGGYQKPPI